jgi:NADH-quinone oxidoreductase subunit D
MSNDFQKKTNNRIKQFLLNFGPQHPAAHGILKIGLQMSGELVLRADMDFGLLHRGSEKLSEKKFYTQVIPYLDRMDYVANLFQEHAYVQAVEELMPQVCTPNVYLTRILFDEFSRILNHLLTISAICLDMGAMGPIF